VLGQRLGSSDVGRGGVACLRVWTAALPRRLPAAGESRRVSDPPAADPA
jgi:hypothetical protein